EQLSPKRVAIRVSEDGPGVAAAVRSSIFEPGVTTKKGGWGVGLSLARRIVEDVHRGQLVLEPAERGALFVATLPAAPEPPEQEAEAEESQTSSTRIT